MSIRRVTDPEADRVLIAAAHTSIGRPVDWETWKAHALEPTSRVYVHDERGLLLHMVLTPHPSVQIVFWVPMAVTDVTQFRERLPILAFGLNDIVAENAAADAWLVWGFIPQEMAEAFRGHFGRVQGQFIVIAEDGTTPRNGLPLVNNVFRASGLVSRIRARAGSLGL